MQKFTVLALAISAALVQATPAAKVVTGKNYRATFEEADSANLEAAPGVANTDVTYQGLNWSNTNLAFQKPPGTATTFFLIPESPEQYGQMPPVFTENANFSRTYEPPNGVISPAKRNKKVQLESFYFGCSRPGPIPGYFNSPVNCTISVTGSGGVGGQGYFAYPEYTPVIGELPDSQVAGQSSRGTDSFIGDCEQLGSQMLSGGGCARLAYVDASQLAGLNNYGPYDSITFSVPEYLTEEANRTSIFVDDVSYSVQKVGV
ncbi:hypothetical protein B0A50_05335 [Salinomyces thailandicus]|uniref:Uncharacterized protein n=1 Tax=Salinomyces thailandicus TaxID=706561 RepID=A0A4U0TW01_9PEZI|nr:hypothetical protein B0A50_05335 [Salinomyces thailandica]